MPVPATPSEMAVTPVLSRVMTLVVSTMLLVGVKVAVQVIPPSALETAVSVPLGIVRSALLKPSTGLLKVMVTCEVSPIFRAVSDITMVAVGGST